MYLPHEQLDSYIQENVMCSEDASGKIAYCAICQQSARHRQDIERHIESAHIETDAFACEVCGWETKTRRTLKIHMKREHQ